MPIRIPPLAITAFTATTALGRGRAAQLDALRARRSGLRANDFSAEPLPCAIGRVEGVEAVELPPSLRDLDSRNHRLAWLGLGSDGFLEAAQAAIGRHGAERVALLVATSTASIGATEAAYTALDDRRFPALLAQPQLHAPHSLGLFLDRVFGARGPCMTVSTACSSSAKIFAQAERMIRLGLADAAILAGVDSLCGSVLFGFNALELVSPQPCRPFDLARNGISIGEAAGFALLERDGARTVPHLIGHGESSDAHHMSTPHPQGLGARRAIAAALSRAGIEVDEVDYINLHGTATPKNDEVEAAVLAAVFPTSTRASSTKGWTGHTLGAAGIVEAVLSLLALDAGLVPGTLNTNKPETICATHLALANEERDLRIALSHSFGFGGNNCVLAFARGSA
ncbi:beta-ketoacyl-ACP synthase [Dokdonella sp.]|uniref:beta-ketoacyl-ACP synthase n=1 Tax=Dokdonella sp. TaxID=2291710 RepID=UPI0025BDC501|nr:beta-ketoacyl-ACP synthase [Dokdonella sp.]